MSGSEALYFSICCLPRICRLAGTSLTSTCSRGWKSVFFTELDVRRAILGRHDLDVWKRAETWNMHGWSSTHIQTQACSAAQVAWGSEVRLKNHDEGLDLFDTCFWHQYFRYTTILQLQKMDIKNEQIPRVKERNGCNESVCSRRGTQLAMRQARKKPWLWLPGSGYTWPLCEGMNRQDLFPRYFSALFSRGGQSPVP